jgi:dUTP pyrophosphatase
MTIRTLYTPVQVEVINEAPDLPLPKYETAGAAGMDLLAAVTEDVVIPACSVEAISEPGEGRSLVQKLVAKPGKALIPTGLKIALPPGYELQIRGRSGLAAKNGVIAHFGTIDEDYRGPIGVILFNLSDEPLVIKRGMRIAQAVVAPVIQVEWKKADELGKTDRGEGGFGSTGKH